MSRSNVTGRGSAAVSGEAVEASSASATAAEIRSMTGRRGGKAGGPAGIGSIPDDSAGARRFPGPLAGLRLGATPDAGAARRGGIAAYPASGRGCSVLLAPHLRDNEVRRPRLRLRSNRLPRERIELRPQFLHLLGVLVRQVRLLKRIGLQVEQLDP